jgi:hypothetical protein
MKTKILYTNGEKTVELFWLTHNGTDVYCGSTGISQKKSYHASGKLHTKADGKQENSTWLAPLKKVKGQFHLMTIGLNNSIEWVNKNYAKLKFSKHKVDNVLYIDARSIPNNETINVSIGLLEPFNFCELSRIIRITKHVKQTLLATGTSPWVYCILIWPFPKY